MKYLLMLSLMLTGCVATVDKDTIMYQAARMDRAVNLIDSGVTTRAEEQAFIKAERLIWHSLDYSINGTPLPADTIPVTTAVK